MASSNRENQTIETKEGHCLLSMKEFSGTRIIVAWEQKQRQVYVRVCFRIVMTY